VYPNVTNWSAITRIYATDTRCREQIVAVGQSTMIITIWVAEHEGEVGILLNDYALGSLFGGRPAFEAKLCRTGFTKV
jgi:hypothetical protein